MLIAKINPPAKKNVIINPFSSTTENLDYMTVIARPYVPGSKKTNFQILFGGITLNESNEPQGFNQMLESQLVLTDEELSTWGTNDEVLFSIIASKLNVSVLEIIDVPGQRF